MAHLKNHYHTLLGQYADQNLVHWQRDVRLIFQHVLGLSHEDFITQSDYVLSEQNKTEINALLSKRLQGMPITKVIGHREFFGRLFLTNEHTLDPRPDSEILIDCCLTHLKKSTPSILDLGTGTGCLVITLACEKPNASGIAVDLSEETLKVTKKNIDRYNLGNRITCQKSDWFSSVLDQKFDVIISNPPYIPTKDIAGLETTVRDYDPHLALDGGTDGLAPYKIILSQAHDYLKEDGIVALEFGHTQKEAISALAKDTGWHIKEHQSDLEGRDRCVVLTKKTPIAVA